MIRVSTIEFTSGSIEGQAIQVHDLDTGSFSFHDTIDGEQFDPPNCEWRNVGVIGETDDAERVPELIGEAVQSPAA